jgi:RND family efflux transporter MFP subunit
MAFALVACGCKGKQEDGPPAGGKAKRGGRQGLTYTVDTLQVESKRVDYIVQAPGTIDAFERVQVTARVAGVVDKVLFTEGQEVKRGQILVTIDAERYALAVAQAKASLDRAKASQADAEAMVTRREGATAEHPGLIPGEELATYRTKRLTARADTEVAAQAAKTAQVNLRDSSVVAPTDGVIQTRTVETGQYVPTGYVMATLLRSEPMLLHFQVEPDAAPRLKPGMMATFRLRETERVFSAKLTLVSAAADLTTHMVAITGEVVATEHKWWLRPGSFCDVTVNLGAQRNSPIIPRTAARATDHGYVSYVIDNGVAQERPLNLGMSTKEGWVEVRSGLKAGEQLVVRGAEPLTSGAKVRATQVTADSLQVSASPANSGSAEGVTEAGNAPAAPRPDVPPVENSAADGPAAPRRAKDKRSEAAP